MTASQSQFRTIDMLRNAKRLIAVELGRKITEEEAESGKTWSATALRRNKTWKKAKKITAESVPKQIYHNAA